MHPLHDVFLDPFEVVRCSGAATCIPQQLASLLFSIYYFFHVSTAWYLSIGKLIVLLSSLITTLDSLL